MSRPEQRATELVKEYADTKFDKQIEPYIVWFAKTLQNWKALVSSDELKGVYFEVTHNGDKKETYIDAYTKLENVAVPD